jgi:hypothetical protein
MRSTPYASRRPPSPSLKTIIWYRRCPQELLSADLKGIRFKRFNSDPTERFSTYTLTGTEISRPRPEHFDFWSEGCLVAVDQMHLENRHPVPGEQAAVELPEILFGSF